tara:strand:+ start:1850 stop:2083 length:234 start_codon:yes stop_codon:yes gene_type:complete
LNNNLKEKNNNPQDNMWMYNNNNYMLFLIGLAFIIIGYIIMSLGTVNSFQSITLSPILLFTGYIIIIPLSLIYRKDK